MYRRYAFNNLPMRHKQTGTQRNRSSSHWTKALEDERYAHRPSPSEPMPAAPGILGRGESGLFWLKSGRTWGEWIQSNTKRHTLIGGTLVLSSSHVSSLLHTALSLSWAASHTPNISTDLTLNTLMKPGTKDSISTYGSTTLWD